MYRLITAGIICLLLNTTCGLEEVPYLPPPLLKTGTTNVIIIQSPDCTGSALTFYRGMEIYYKFYKNDVIIPDVESNINLQNNLATYGYFPLVSSDDKLGDIKIPLIKIDAGDRTNIYTITLNFDNISSFPEEATATGYGTISLRRGFPGNYYNENDITSSTGETTTGNLWHYKRFSDMSIDDLDMPSGITPETEQLKLAFYAITYGKDGLNTVYSQPVYLNSITIPFTKR